MSTSPKLSRVIEGFIYAKESQGRSNSTIIDYKLNMIRFCDYLDDPPIGEITPEQITQFFHWLQFEYTFDPSHSGKKKTQKLSPKTIANVWIVLSSFWHWAEFELRIPNPFRIPRIRAKPKPIVPLTPEEIKRLLKSCDSYLATPSNRSQYKVRRVTKLTVVLQI